MTRFDLTILASTAHFSRTVIVVAIFEFGGLFPPELFSVSSSDMDSSVSRLSLRCFLFLAAGPLVKFPPFIGGGGGGGLPPPTPGGEGGTPAGLSCTRLRLLDGSCPSRLS